MLDLSDPNLVCLAPSDLTGPDYELCQAVAAAAVSGGYEGLLVPSAALPGLNLVLLPDNLAEPPPIRVVRSTELPLDSIAGQHPTPEPGDSQS